MALSEESLPMRRTREARSSPSTYLHGQDGTPSASPIFENAAHVDGEDLASLVRRIGRLSSDKAIEIARQVCAGLAAAHDRGVIHRDLKPANLMLDSTGKIRITDFGLAAIAASLDATDVKAGTPPTWLPSSSKVKEVTVRSDLYSLGLVLYEILTGKRAFNATTLPELMKQRESSVPASPSTPRSRPRSTRRARHLALPGERSRAAPGLRSPGCWPAACGDPLAAALAAGERLHPEMVAAAALRKACAPGWPSPCSQLQHLDCLPSFSWPTATSCTIAFRWTIPPRFWPPERGKSSADSDYAEPYRRPKPIHSVWK